MNITNSNIVSNIIELNKEELKIMIHLANNITAIPSEDPQLFCQQSKNMSLLVPQRIKDVLFLFFKECKCKCDCDYECHCECDYECDYECHCECSGSNNGFLLFKGLGLNDNNDLNFKTPSDNNSKVGEKTILSKIQSIFINLIADLIAYEAEGYGRLFQDIVPIKKMENLQTSVSSAFELEIHTEQAFSKLRPDILSLACLRGDKDALTFILPVKTILNHLTSDEIKLLRLPLWKIGIDLSFKLNNNTFIDGDIRGPIPIIYGDINDPFLVFDKDLMTGVSEEAELIIQKIINIYYKNRIQHNFQSGQIMFIDNRRALHGRSCFFPKYDGNDRFLIRCFATFNYENSFYARNNGDRIVQAIYS